MKLGSVISQGSAYSGGN